MIRGRYPRGLYPNVQNRSGGNIQNQIAKNTLVHVVLCCLCFLMIWPAVRLHGTGIVTEQPTQERMFKGSVVAAWPLMVCLQRHKLSVPELSAGQLMAHISKAYQLGAKSRLEVAYISQGLTPSIMSLSFFDKVNSLTGKCCAWVQAVLKDIMQCLSKSRASKGAKGFCIKLILSALTLGEGRRGNACVAEGS